MKIAAVSDIHYRYNFEIPKCDLFVVAGDMLGNGNYDQLLEFDLFLHKQRHKFGKCLITPGNHDRIFQTNIDACRLAVSNATIVIDEEIEIDGKRMYFSPWTPEFLNWHFMYARGQEAKELWSKIPEGLDLLVTHGPPYGILDQTDGRYNGVQENVGCKDLVERLKAMKSPPRCHVFGHIHHSFGSYYDGRTQYFNVALCDEDYKPTRTITQFEI